MVLVRKSDSSSIGLCAHVVIAVIICVVAILLCQCKSDPKPENVYCATEHTLHLLCRGQFKEPFGVRLEPGECISTPRPCETLTVQPEYVISSTLVINGDRK